MLPPELELLELPDEELLELEELFEPEEPLLDPDGPPELDEPTPEGFDPEPPPEQAGKSTTVNARTTARNPCSASCFMHPPKKNSCNAASG